MIELSNLTHIYRAGQDDAVAALDKINLKIASGEFVVILGTNGSGKSTLAKHLNGLLLPTSGDVTVAGFNTKDPETLWTIRQMVGMIFQNPDNQIVATVVEEDVAFGPENLGIPSVEIRQRIDDALKIVHLSEYARFEPHLLSAGQKQRVAIAGVLAMMPRCLVLDEPTSMLDPLGQKEIMAILRELNAEHQVTVIHITHFVEEAIYADKILVMEKGKIVLEGPPRHIFADLDGLKELGIIPPPMTVLAQRLARAGLSLSLPILTVEEAVEALCALNSLA